MHTLSAQIPTKLALDLNKLAKILSRPKSWIVREALRDYFELQKIRRRMIKEGLVAARKNKLIPDDKIYKGN